MRFKSLLFVLVTAVACAQIAPEPGDKCVFTLPEPTTWKMPDKIKLVLMALVSGPPAQSALWRDEYKEIRNDRKLVKAWLLKNMRTVIIGYNYMYFNDPEYSSIALQHVEKWTPWFDKVRAALPD